jgi:two-component system, NarL family, response regulator LiaR
VDEHPYMPPPSRIMIADDHPLWCSCLRSLLECSDSSMEVVAEATDGQQALELALSLKPDLVLMDVRMPKVDGLEATRAIKRELPQTVVLMITASEDPNHLAEAIKAGAAGHVLKSAPTNQITHAIRAALDGEPTLNQEIARRLILGLMDEQRKEQRSPSEVATLEGSPPALGGKHSQGEGTLPSSLTVREIEVLRLLIRGHSNQQIARNLLISTSTVKKHVRRIIAKLGVSDRTQAAVRAVELDLRPEGSGLTVATPTPRRTPSF